MHDDTTRPSLAHAQELARQATRTAKFRGHTLSAWQWTHTADRTTGAATCHDCHRGAYVDTRPAPNGIDISGDAIALNCLIICRHCGADLHYDGPSLVDPTGGDVCGVRDADAGAGLPHDAE